MTDHDMNHDAHALSGAYAIDALDDIERVRFEAHLRDCAECRTEVAELRETAALLGSDTEVEPPAGLRDSVLAGIEEIRPLPPLVPFEPEPDERAAHPAGAPDAPTHLAERRRRRLRMPLLVAAAVVLLLGVGATIWASPWSDSPAPSPAPTATERVLTADDATRVTQRFPDGSSATVIVSRAEDRAVIVTEDMAPAPDGKVYELWFETPEGGMEPAGLMPEESDATVLLAGEVGAHTGVGITVEPVGGSEEPTSEPIAYFGFDA
jgi:anti-sigma factor RsiW